MKKTLLFTLLTGMLSSTYAKDFTVHEWGTFTSFSGSSGKVYEGMHHEDEALPNFVYGLVPGPLNNQPFYSGACNFPSKVPCDVQQNLRGISIGESLPQNPVGSGITQKMETPVIYFYGEEGTKVQVDIDFPQGLITQYYPKAKSAFPRYTNQVNKLKSKFSFAVDLGGKSDLRGVLPTKETSIWNPAREVPAANTVEVDGEKEKFIFYRGVGKFDTEFKIEQKNEMLALQNLSHEQVSSAFVINSDGKNFGAFTSTNSIAAFSASNGAGESLVRIPDYKSKESYPYSIYLKKLKGKMQKALVQSGLFEDEAKSMLNTWERSYFRTPGLRVLYIVTRSTTDRILPIKVSPVPDHLERVLIGRVEFLTHDQELKLMDQILKNGIQNPEEEFGRFYEPVLRRLLDLATESKKLNSSERQMVRDSIQKVL